MMKHFCDRCSKEMTDLEIEAVKQIKKRAEPKESGYWYIGAITLTKSDEDEEESAKKAKDRAFVELCGDCRTALDAWFANKPV
jgi:hypothetical protein